MNILSQLKIILPYFRMLRWYFVLLLVITICISSITLLPPYLSKIIFDSGILLGNKGVVVNKGLMLIATYIIIFVLSYYNSLYFNILGSKFTAKLKTDLFKRILNIPLNYFDNLQSGYIIQRMGEIESLNTLFSSVIFLFISSLFAFVGAFVLILIVDWVILLVALLMIPLFYMLTLKSSKNVLHSSRDLLETTARSRGVYQEAIMGIEELKNFNMEDKKHKDMDKLINEIKNQSITRSKWLSFGNEAINLYKNITGVVLVVVIGIFIVNQRLSIGDYVALTQYTIMLFGPIQLLTTFNLNVQPGLAALTRLQHLYELKTEGETRGDLKINLPVQNVVFDKVSFKYDGNGENILNTVSFTVSRGEKIAIVGPTGSGKTTITKLMMGYYTDYGGNIYVNNIELRDLDVTDLRKNISIVSQNIFLFSGTIHDNLRVVNEKYTKNTLKNILLKSGFSNADDALNVFIYEGGKNLSGGEKQKIAIARALIKDSDIIILDEASAHLDDNTKEQLIHQFRDLLYDKLCVIITHDKKLSSLADKVYYIENGALAEMP